MGFMMVLILLLLLMISHDLVDGYDILMKVFYCGNVITFLLHAYLQ